MCHKAASAGQMLKRQMAAQQNGASAHVEQPTSCAGMQKKKTSSQMQGTVQNSQQTATDSSTHIQSCLSRPPDQVATLTLNYCCNFSQAEPVEVPHPSFCFHCLRSSFPRRASRYLAISVLSLSLCLAASALRLRFLLFRSPVQALPIFLSGCEGRRLPSDWAVCFIVFSWIQL